MMLPPGDYDPTPGPMDVQLARAGDWFRAEFETLVKGGFDPVTAASAMLGVAVVALSAAEGPADVAERLEAYSRSLRAVGK